MIVRIVDTPDRQFLGFEFDSKDNPIILTNGIVANVDKVLPIPNGFRFISSNYIIDTVKV